MSAVFIIRTSFKIIKRVRKR